MLSRIVLATALCMSMEAVVATPLELGVDACKRGEQMTNEAGTGKAGGDQ